MITQEDFNMFEATNIFYRNCRRQQKVELNSLKMALNQRDKDLKLDMLYLDILYL